jgi:hypothetical protein
MKKNFLLGVILFVSFLSYGQNPYYIQAPVWGLKSAFPNNLPSPGKNLGNYPTNGYDGRGSEQFATQNIQGGF